MGKNTRRHPETRSESAECLSCRPGDILIIQAGHASVSINELKSLMMGFFATLYNNVPAAFPISGPRKGMGMKRLPSLVDIALTAADAQASAIPIAHSFPVHSPLMYREEFSMTPNAPVTVADATSAGTWTIFVAA